MNLIRKLGWFFKLEKKRYIIGILALSLVSVFNLIPPRVIGVVIDRIASRNLTSEQLLLNLSLLVASAFIMYGGSISLVQQIIWDDFYVLNSLSTLPKWHHLFTKNIEQEI